MRPVSLKTAARNRRYARERREYLAEHPFCEIRWDGSCTGRATEVHHMAGRYPSVFFDQALWLAGCHGCHDKATRFPAEAIRRGLSVRRHHRGGAA